MGMKQLFSLWISWYYSGYKTPVSPVVKMIQPLRGWLIVKLFGLDLVVMSGSLAGRKIYIIPASLPRYNGNIGVAAIYNFMNDLSEFHIFPKPNRVE